jgi:hypothetical protein
VSLENTFSLEAAQAKRLGELVMRDPVLPVEFHQEHLASFTVEVGSAAPKFLLDFTGNLKADVHKLSFVMLESVSERLHRRFRIRVRQSFLLAYRTVQASDQFGRNWPPD